MSRQKKVPKRGKGRPKKGPYDLQAEREIVARTLRERRAERLGIEDIQIEEHTDRVMALSHRNKLSKQELDELRETSLALYERTIELERELDAFRNERYVDAMRAAAIDKALEQPAKSQPKPESQMSWEDWCREHNLRYNGKRKPGPPKAKKKTVFDIAPGERGTAAGPSEPIDPQVFEDQWMDAQIAKRKEEERFIKGKRLRKTADPPPRRAEPKNFWI